MKKTKILQGSIMKEKKMIKGRIMKKTRIPRSNILRNIISKKRTKKKITTKSTTGFRELKKFVTINVKMSWHKKENCSMISTKKNYL